MASRDNKEICRLRQDIKRLTEEVKKKEALVNDLIEISHRQSLHISSLNAALQDSLTTDTNTYPSPLCATPCSQTRTNTLGSTCINLTNRYSALAVDSPAPAAAPTLSNLDSAIEFPPLHGGDTDPRSSQGSSPPVSTQPTSSESRQPHKKGGKTSARRNIIKEAVRRRSSGPPGMAPVLSLSPLLHAPSQLPEVSRPQQAAAQPVASPRSPVASRPQHSASREVSPRSSPAEPRSQQAAVQSVIPDEGAQQQVESTALGAGPEPVSQPVAPVSPLSSPHVDASESGNPRPAHQPKPLFPITTVVIGDSIIRNIRSYHAATYCFPGATVSRITEKLPGILQSMPPSVHKVIVHVGINDVSKRQSELTKMDFIELFGVLSPWFLKGVSVFISGPIPALNRGDEHFSRTFHLNSWLKSVCKPPISFISFIDNFSLFMDRPSHFETDGLHLNWRGCCLLTSHMQLISHCLAKPARD